MKCVMKAVIGSSLKGFLCFLANLGQKTEECFLRKVTHNLAHFGNVGLSASQMSRYDCEDKCQDQGRYWYHHP